MTRARIGDRAFILWCLAGVAIALAACGRTPSSTATPHAITRVEQTSGTNALLIAVSPVDERTGWVSGSLGTWLRTTDGGATWKTGRVPGGDSLQFRDVHAVNATTAYLLSIGNGNQSRIYKTTDAGANWTLQFTNQDPKGFYDCMSFWDANRGIVIGDALGTEIAMLTTTDGGAHWTRVNPETLPAAQAEEGSFAASGTCVVTRPGGRAWIVASNAGTASIRRRRSVIARCAATPSTCDNANDVTAWTMVAAPAANGGTVRLPRKTSPASR